MIADTCTCTHVGVITFVVMEVGPTMYMYTSSTQHLYRVFSSSDRY